MLNMTYADYFYLISYPTYSGFKVEHDPIYTAYAALTSPTTGQPNFLGLLIIGAVAVIAAVVILKRRGSKTPAIQPTT